MAAPLNMLLAGFGGQGILFAGKLIAYAGLIEGRELSWLPSYGPEMRGGTANCSVCLADEPIGSPLVLEPDVLVAMNQPSLDKFADSVVPGGKIIVDSTMCQRLPVRDDVDVFPVPATQLAEENGLKGLASVILVGKLLREIGFCDPRALDEAIAKSVPPKKAHLLPKNRKAFEIGMLNEDGESVPACSLPEDWSVE
ncbi:MAG: 2-oxoacid:acceptor oxidoreductase family protein [Coriobacteriia bacterium]|nr:2-oxoacid:acceptor oxidoreductase family protein [Coriobacteriia bacterium]